MTREDAVELLTISGFSIDEAQRQIDRFQLNPGYQLCYSLGRYEFMQLRKTWGDRIGKERLHSFILDGGELPFHLIEERLQSVSKRSVD